MTLNVQNVHRWLTHIAYMYLQSLMVVFHIVVSGFLR